MRSWYQIHGSPPKSKVKGSKVSNPKIVRQLIYIIALNKGVDIIPLWLADGKCGQEDIVKAFYVIEEYSIIPKKELGKLAKELKNGIEAVQAIIQAQNSGLSLDEIADHLGLK